MIPSPFASSPLEIIVPLQLLPAIIECERVQHMTQMIQMSLVMLLMKYKQRLCVSHSLKHPFKHCRSPLWMRLMHLLDGCTISILGTSTTPHAICNSSAYFLLLLMPGLPPVLVNSAVMCLQLLLYPPVPHLSQNSVCSVDSLTIFDIVR
jgi:hypothetical protein